MANLIALIYNWWHLYARMFDGEHHREAITSRPALLNGVGRLAQHSGQKTIKVSLQHENKEEIEGSSLFPVGSGSFPGSAEEKRLLMRPRTSKVPPRVPAQLISRVSSTLRTSSFVLFHFHPLEIARSLGSE